MGASVFVNVVKRKNAKDAKDAFEKEVEQSQYDHGRCSTLKEACDEADRLVEDDERYSDKWGPAFLIEVDGDEGGWVFFGWASS